MRPEGQLTTTESITRIGKSDTLWRFQGWVNSVRSHGKLVFMDLRDFSGVIQCVGRNIMKDLNTEDVVSITGTIAERPEHLVNPEMKTGKWEVVVKTCEILNKCKELPIPIDSDGYEIAEEMRLKHRYLDLRRVRMRRNIMRRSAILHAIQGHLGQNGWYQIETPMLTKSTKEGARDFVVPSRLNPGQFYALPQSPQQYKQLLMTAGFSHYYQIARCVRDENLRADRGFEFTQLDMEIAFANEWKVLFETENVLRAVLYKTAGWTYEYEQSLGLHGELQRYEILDNAGLTFPLFTYAEAMEKFGTDKPDIRTPKQKEKGDLLFCWVARFPMYKKVASAEDKLDSKSEYTFMHNPFSMPIPEHLESHMKGTDLGEITAQQYDLVCNGYEIGSGSVRAHTRPLLEATFRNMGYGPQEIEDNIGHMLTAFDLGTPPHAGIALGIDRLAMLICKETSLKEVIPFPTSNSGKTAVMDAPSDIADELREELGIEKWTEEKP